MWAIIAVLFMLGFLAGLGLRAYAGYQSILFLGPDHMAASADRVYVHANGHLFVLTHQGDSVRHLSPDELQLAGLVIDLRVMPDGDVLIAERMPARIRLCDAERWECSLVSAPLAEHLPDQFKVLPDVSGSQLYITDSTKGGGLFKVDIRAGSIEQILTGELSYPNDIQYGPDGELWIADSFNRRVVNVRVDEDGAELMRVRFNMRNEVAVENRTWPMMLQTPGGDTWIVTQTPASGGQADLMLYQDEKTMPRRLPIAAGLDPTDIAIASGKLLVSDILGFSVYTIDTESGQHASWGDRVFNEWLSKQQGQHEAYQSWEGIGLVLMLACAPFMLIAGYLGTSRKKRKSVFSLKSVPALVPSDDPPPSLPSIYWLKRNKKLDRLFRWMVPVATILIVLMILATGYLFSEFSQKIEAEKFREISSLFLILGGIVIGMVPLMYININIMRSQLGTDGQRIFIRYPDDKQVSALARQIVFTKYLIHFDKHTVSIKTGKNQALYEDGELETYIMPLLTYGRKVGGLGLFTQQLDDGEYGQVYVLLYIFAVIAAAIYLEFGEMLKSI